MYTALKYCSFAGQTFRTGETVPDELIDPKAISRLKKSGVIAEHGADQLLSAPCSMDNKDIGIPVFHDEQVIKALLSGEQVEIWAAVLQKNANEAAELVNDIDDNDLLMVIHATDSRKSVKSAAEARAAALNPAPAEEPEPAVDAEELTEQLTEPAEAVDQLT